MLLEFVTMVLLEAFDITPAEAARLKSPMGDHLPQGHAIPPEDFYIDLSAYGFSMEIPNAEFCERIAKALREHYGFSEPLVHDACSYYRRVARRGRVRSARERVQLPS